MATSPSRLDIHRKQKVCFWMLQKFMALQVLVPDLMKFHLPGLFGKAGLNFDWATYDDFVKSAETGIGAELYLKEIPIMIQENNKPLFVYLYLSLQFGKKW